MNSASRIAGFLSIFLLLMWPAVLHPAKALVNPEHIKSETPERLEVEILERKIQLEGPIQKIWLRAGVLAVRYSQSGLKPGEEIEISYIRDMEHMRRIEEWFAAKSREPGWAGDSPSYPPNPPNPGQSVGAFLRLAPDSGQRTYVPAANQYSFDYIR